jgi:hypothetical protein
MYRALPQISASDVDRFWAKVELLSTGCWVWKGARGTSHGYGQFGCRGLYLAHRVAYFIYYGKFDVKLKVLHHCDNPPCVNPLHLFLGTNKDNSRDMLSKGRCKMGPGESCPRAKLDNKNISAIREAKGIESAASLAIKFKVTKGTIYHIWQGRTWSHLIGDESCTV